MNTPFQWGKQVASHLGGTRNPLVVSWPKRIKDAGGMRTQFHHCIDIVPTILEAAGIPEPTSVNGVTQKPIEGVSMVYSFADANARGNRKTQYFEMFGNRAVYDNGWIATCRHGRLPWENAGSYDFDKDEWQLYNLGDDFSEANDLAAKNPQKLKELQDLFWIEATKYNVLPLDDRFIERADPAMRPSLIEGRTKFTYFPGTRRVPESSSPNVKNKSHSITADVEIPKDGADGVLVAAGGIVGGYALFVKDGKPTYEYNYFTVERFKIAGKDALTAGKHTIRFEFKYDGGGVGKGGTGTLFVDGNEVARGRIDKTVLGRFSADETFDTGEDTGSPVSDLYKAPFRFEGRITKIEIELGPEKVGAADLEKLRKANALFLLAE
jgi:arylsulfatase